MLIEPDVLLFIWGSILYGFSFALYVLLKPDPKLLGVPQKLTDKTPHLSLYVVGNVG